MFLRDKLWEYSGDAKIGGTTETAGTGWKNPNPTHGKLVEQEL